MRKIQNIFRMKKGKIRNQRGVALIFTLGILGLLTVMALGFASTAMLNQKIASNSAGASSARMLAQVGVQRALTAVALYTADAANNAVGFSDIFSREYGSGKTGNQNTCDFIWKLTTKINDIPLYELPVDYDNKSGVTWQYVTDPSDTTNNTLIGRYAYVVVPYYGALDPSVNYGQSFTDSTANPDNKLFTVYNIDMDKGISKGLKDTFGITSLEKTDGAIKTSLDDVYGKRFYDLSDYVKRILYDKSWGEATGFENMLKRMKLFYYLKNIFAINPYAYPEAYWIDCDKTGSDQKRASDHYLHRLSLDALVTDWEGVSDGNYASKIDSLTNADNITSLQYSSTAPGVSPLPWLAAWQGPESSDLESANWTADLQKKQIAANLIQYNLGADKPSVSNVATNAFSDTDVKGPELEYLGIGRHPYINEIGVEARVVATGTFDSTDPTVDRTLSYTLKPSLSFQAELVNMYDTVAIDVSKYKLYFYGRFSFTCKKTPDGTDDTITWSTSGSGTENHVLLGSVVPGAFSSGYSSMILPADDSILSTSVKTECSSPSLTGTLTVPANTVDYENKFLLITGMNLQITKVVLVADSTLIRDYAMPEAAAVTETNVGNIPTLVAEPNYYVKSYQTADPRVNHYPSDWKKGEKYNTPQNYSAAVLAKIDADGITAVTPGAKNTELLEKYTDKFNGTDYDKETVTEIACTGTATGRLSSAMIRHGKMRSLAELGLIHRASPFQTLNLKKARYIKRDTELKKAGGASYKEGDANILDQLKLRGNDVMKQYGKVNINTASHETLQALFNSVPYQKLVDSPLPADANAYEIFKTAPVAAKYVKDVADAEVTGARKACGNYHPTASGDHPSCLACSIINRREVLQFKARSDLMLDLNDSAVWSNFNGDNENFYHVPALPGGATSKADALKAISVSGQMTQGPAETSTEITDVSVENDWEQEQLIGHLADVITAEPPDLCIIAIGQTLKDIGGSKVYRNWGMSSIPSIKDDYYSSSDDTYRLYRKAGYIRPGQTNDYLENNQSSSVLGKGILKVADTPISKDKDVELGVYDVGFDKITGESKMIVWVRKDPVTQKWKVVRTMYAE